MPDPSITKPIPRPFPRSLYHTRFLLCSFPAQMEDHSLFLSIVTDRDDSRGFPGCPEIYRSDAKLMVRIGRESVTLDPTATTGQVIAVGPSRESEINSEMEILKSRGTGAESGGCDWTHRPYWKASKANPKQGPWAQIKNMLRRNFESFSNKWQRRIQNFLIKLGGIKSLTDREKAIIQFTKNFTVERAKKHQYSSPIL